MGNQIKVQVQFQFFSLVQQRPQKLGKFAKSKFNFGNLTTNEPGPELSFHVGTDGGTRCQSDDRDNRGKISIQHSASRKQHAHLFKTRQRGSCTVVISQ